MMDFTRPTIYLTCKNDKKQIIHQWQNSNNQKKNSQNNKTIFIDFQNQITWIRRRDWHILSSGDQMYTNDERFGILHTPGSNTWTLQIKFVQRRDHGMYECQVSGDSKFYFLFFGLHISFPCILFNNLKILCDSPFFSRNYYRKKCMNCCLFDNKNHSCILIYVSV